MISGLKCLKLREQMNLYDVKFTFAFQLSPLQQLQVDGVSERQLHLHLSREDTHTILHSRDQLADFLGRVLPLWRL